MDHVLGQNLLGGQPVCEAVCGGRIAPVELVEGLPVPDGKASVELQIVPVALTHDPFVSEGGKRPSPTCSNRRSTFVATLVWMRIVLYTRPGCHLCDVAREVIAAERARRIFEFEEVDISLDDSLEMEYGIRIPVVTVEGEERFETEVDAEELAALLRAG
jgi:Glutaredoxin-like domain (DUF836).